MTLSRFQTLANALSQHIQDGRLVIDENLSGISELAGFLSLFPERRLGLSGVAIDIQERSLGISGRWDGSFPIPGTPSLFLADTTLGLTLSASAGEDAVSVRLTAATDTPWVLLPERLTVSGSSLEFLVTTAAGGGLKLEGGLQGTVAVAGKSFPIYLALGQGSWVSAGIACAQGDAALVLADVGSLLGDGAALAPIDAALNQLGFGGVQLRNLTLNLDLSSPASLSLEIALRVALRDVALDAFIRSPPPWLSAGISPDTPVDLKKLAAQLGLDSPDLPALALAACGVELDLQDKVMVIGAGLRGDWRLPLGKTSLAFTELDLKVVAKPAEVTATLDASSQLGGAVCHAWITLPAFEMAVALAPDSSLSLVELTNALVPDELAIPPDALTLSFTTLELVAQPRQQTFSLTASTVDMWPLPFGQGLSLGKLAAKLAVARSEGQLQPSASLAGTLSIGGAELTGQLNLKKGDSSLTLTQGASALDVTQVIASFVPGGIALPAELGGIEQLKISGLAGSFNVSTKKYAFSGTAALTNLTLGALGVANAQGSLEITGTGSTLETLQITLDAEPKQELVPDLRVEAVRFILDLKRTETGWQWHVGGGLVAGLFDLPPQTLTADASNGQFLFTVKSDPALTWSLPEAADALKLEFSRLALALSRDAATGQTSWKFAGTGGLTIAELPSLSGTLELLYGAEQKGFRFAGDKPLGVSLPLVPGNDRLKLGFEVGAGSLSLIKTTVWTLSAASSLKVKVPAPEAGSADPIDQALSLLSDMFRGEMGAELSVTPSSAALSVSGLPQPPVPIPVLVGHEVIWDKLGSVGLSRLTLRLGKTLSGGGQLRLRLPEEINNVFGQTSEHKPKTQVFNTEWAFSVSYDDTDGLSLAVDSFPFNLNATTYIKDEVDGDKTWKRFTLGEIITFRFGSFAEAEKPDVKWLHVNFGELGWVRFLPPRFSFNGSDFKAGGAFEILKPLHIPTAPVKWLLRKCQLDDIAGLLPDSIAPLDIHVLESDGKTFSADKFVDTVGNLARAMGIKLPGLREQPEQPDLPELKKVVSVFAGPFNQLPEDLRDYLDITLPTELAFDIAVTPAAGFGVKLDIRAPKEPIKLLIPTTDLLLVSSPAPLPALYGLTIRKLSFGEVLEGSLLLVAADMDIDYFDLFSLASALALPPSVSEVFTHTPDIQKKLILKDLLCLVVYETAVPIPIPIYFEAVGAKYFGLEGTRSQLVLHNNLAGLTLGTLCKGLWGLYKELRKFFTEETYTLPDDVFSKNGLNLGVHVNPGFVQLPKYLGGGVLGSKQELFNLGIDQLLVPLVNYFKNVDVDKLLSIIPLAHRNGALGTGESLQLGPFRPQASWLFSTAGEFDRLVADRAQRQSPFVNALYDEHATQGDEFVSLLKQVAAEADGTARQGAIFYARGGMKLEGMETELYAYAGLFADKNRGFLTQWKIKGQAGPIVSVDMGGSFAVVRQAPVGNVNATADLKLSGYVKLTVLGHEALSAQLALQNGVFSFSSQLSLFPDGSTFQAKANVSGWISDKALEVQGQATLALAPLPAAQATLVVTQQRTTLALSWLQQDWLLEVRAQPQGQVRLDARATRPVVVGPNNLLRLLDAASDDAGPALLVIGPSLPAAQLTGRVSIEKFGVSSSGFLSIGEQRFSATLSTTFLGWNSSLSLRGTTLEQAESIEYVASFKQDLLSELAQQLKRAFESISRAIDSALDQAKATFDREWAKFKKLVEDGAEAIRAGLLDAKAKVEKVLAELDGMVKQTIDWIGVKDDEIAERTRFLDGLTRGAQDTVNWLEARAAEAQRNLDGKNEEINSLDRWYFGLDENGKFWNGLYYGGRRVQLLIERDVLPGILQRIREELARAKDGIQKSRQDVDHVLVELDRVRRGFAEELRGYRQAILDRKKEWDHYTELLGKSAEELLKEFGRTVDSTVKDAAEKAYNGTKLLKSAMDEALSVVLQQSGLRLPLEILRLEIKGGLSVQQGSTFSAIADIQVNFLPGVKVVENFPFSVDLRSPGDAMRSLASTIWESREKLKVTDYEEYKRQRDAQLLSEVSQVSDLRNRLGPEMGEPLSKKLLHEQDWHELAKFYDYALQNCERLPSLHSAIAVLSRFHRLLSDYQAAELAARSWLKALDVRARLDGFAADIADPFIPAKRAMRSLLDEVARLYKAEFLRRVAQGVPVDDIQVDVPADPAACLFSGVNFAGNMQTLLPGRYDLSALSIGNDAVRSVWVKQGYRLTLFEDPGFQGRSVQLQDDQTYLHDFERITSSVVVEHTGGMAPQLEAWARVLPVPGSPVWKPGFRVRYAFAYEYADGRLERGNWWSPTSGGVSADANGYLSASYACPILSGIPCDPTGKAVARRIYRQFDSLPERMIHRIANNTDTQWIDDDLGIQEAPVPAPQLSVWVANLPVASSPVWQSGCRVRYAIAYEFADGSIHRSGWWCPTSGGVSADEHGYLSCRYACPVLTGISVDPTGQAVARRIYRQFRDRPERMIYRIPNNTDTSYTDTDQGIVDHPLRPPQLARWTVKLPVPDDAGWQPGFQVRYAIAYEFADGSQHRSPWWNPSGSVIPADREGYVRGERACAMLKDIACDPTGLAVARVIYRQFRGQPERLLHRLPNNTETTWTDSILEGANTFVLGTDHNLYKWNGSQWDCVPGSGTRIAVGPTGQVFLLNAEEGHSIKRRDGQDWTPLPGAALDIAIGADGSLFVLGIDNKLCKWNGSQWDGVPGSGTRIAVGPTGQVFLLSTDDNDSILCRAGDGWTRLPGRALEVAAGGLPPAVAHVQPPKALRKSLGPTIALRASNGKYVSAAVASNQPLVAKASTAGAQETFEAVSAGFGKIGLLAPTGFYVGSSSDSDARLSARAYAVTPEETLTVYDLGDGKLAFQAANGRYVQAASDGTLRASASEIQTTEIFELQDHSAVQATGL